MYQVSKTTNSKDVCYLRKSGFGKHKMVITRYEKQKYLRIGSLEVNFRIT